MSGPALHWQVKLTAGHRIENPMYSPVCEQAWGVDLVMTHRLVVLHPYLIWRNTYENMCIYKKIPFTITIAVKHFLEIHEHEISLELSLEISHSLKVLVKKTVKTHTVCKFSRIWHLHLATLKQFPRTQITSVMSQLRDFHTPALRGHVLYKMKWALLLCVHLYKPDFPTIFLQFLRLRNSLASSSQVLFLLFSWSRPEKKWTFLPVQSDPFSVC